MTPQMCTCTGVYSIASARPSVRARDNPDKRTRPCKHLYDYYRQNGCKPRLPSGLESDQPRVRATLGKFRALGIWSRPAAPTNDRRHHQAMSLEQTQRNQNSDRTESSTIHYRIRYCFGDLELTSEWHPEFATVENFAEQLRREHAAHDVRIEKRLEVPF